MNEEIKPWARTMVDRAGQLALLCMLVTSAFYTGMIPDGVRIDNRPEAFASADSDAPEILNTIRDQFGRDDVFVVLIEGSAADAAYIDRLRSLEDAVKTMTFVEEATDPDSASATAQTPADEEAESDWGDDDWGDNDAEDIEGVALNPIDQTISLLSVRRTTGQQGSIVVERLFPDDSAVLDTGAFFERVDSNRFATENLISRDRNHSALIVQTEPMEDARNIKFYFALKEIVESQSADGFRLKLVGLPSLIAQMDQDTQMNIGAITLAAMLVMSVVLLTLFRFWSAIVGPLLVVMIGSIWSFGFMGWTGITMNYVSAIIPAFLIIVGLADAIHLQSSYAGKLATIDDPRDALAAAIAKTAVPIIFTSITTMVGLISFRAASVEAVRELGFSGSIGIMGAMFSTLTLLPFFLRLDRKGKMVSKKRKAQGQDTIDRVLGRINWLSGKGSVLRRNIVLGCGFLIFVSAGYGVTKAQIDHDPLKFYFSDHPLRVGIETMDSEITGAGSMSVLVQREDGVKDLGLLKMMEAFEKDLRAYKKPSDGQPLVTSAASLLNVVKETNQALREGDPYHYRLPDTQRGISDAIFLFENASLDDSRRVLSVDGTKTLMSFNLHWIAVTELEHFIDFVDERIGARFGEKAKVDASGLAYSLTSTLGVLVHDLYRSFGAAILMVTLLMVFVFRDLKLGLISMIPNVFPIMVSVLVMLAFEIPLNLSNILIASIAIGICVDDTIHFFHHFRQGYKLHNDVEKGIQHAIESTGRAMVLTTVVLVLGLSSYLGGTLTSLVHFGLLVNICVVLALFSDLLFAPAILRVLYGKKEPAA